MNLETLRTNHHKILGCEVKDHTGLNDFQKLPDSFGVAIPKVGIERFRIPLTFITLDGQKISHDVYASMFVNLESGKTGVNMSRFCQILQSVAGERSVDHNFFEIILNRFRTDLRDSTDEELIDNSYLKLDFNYCVKQQSLKSDNWGYQYYKVILEGRCNKDGLVTLSTTVNFEYSSTCPCSLSMAKQYEEEYRKGITTEGNGIGVAHGQRSNAKVKVNYLSNAPMNIESLIVLLRKALPTETQSLVKRVDEQAFAILNGENPMFVEHASRRLKLVLDQEQNIMSWDAKIEHFESLHSHNAVAYISSH